MADVRELPEHVREFIDMAKEYLRQETLVPAKQLGRFGGMALAGGFAFALGVLFLAIAGMRYLRRALPDGPNWSALGYLIAAVALVVFMVLTAALTNSRTAKRRS